MNLNRYKAISKALLVFFFSYSLASAGAGYSFLPPRKRKENGKENGKERNVYEQYVRADRFIN